MEHHLQRRVAGQEMLQRIGHQDLRRGIGGKVAPLPRLAQPIDDGDLMPGLGQGGVQVGSR